MLSRLHEIKQDRPTPEHFAELADIKRGLDGMKGTPLQGRLPKSFSLAMAIYGMQMQRIYQAFPTHLPDDTKADDLCDRTMTYLDKLEEIDFMPDDVKFLKKEGPRFDFDITKPTPTYVSTLRTEVSSKLCPEPDPCTPPRCPESYRNDEANRDLYKIFKTIVEPSTIDLPSGTITRDSLAIIILLSDLNQLKRKHDISDPYTTSKWSGLIYALSVSLLRKARFMHIMDGDFTPADKPKLKERVEGLCETVLVALTQLQQKCDETNELCNRNNHIGRCILLDLAPEISEDNLLPWVNREIDLMSSYCNRDTCLNSKALNYYAEGYGAGYRHKPELCVFCGCTDTMFMEGEVFMGNFGDQNIISEVDSCKTDRRGCKLECDLNYCADCDIADYAKCANQNLCGCLDSTAVNWAHDTIFNANSDYFKNWVNLSVSKHDSTACIYTGCKDSTAMNYHPRARESDGDCVYREGCMDPCAANYDSLAVRDDGSCKIVCGCTYPDASNYDRRATNDDGSCHFADNTPNTQLKRFIEFLEEKGLYEIREFVNRAVAFRNCGDDEQCLRIEIDADGVVMDGRNYGLGLYTNGIADEFVKKLMEFYNSVSDDRQCFERSDIELICVGTADANPIKGQGITYKGEKGAINSSYFCLPSNFLVDQDRLQSIPSGRSQRLQLSHGSLIMTNCELAAVRAAIVADPIISYYEDPVLRRGNSAEIKLGGRAYIQDHEKGGEYRGVMFRLDIPRFFSCVSAEAETKEDPVKRVAYEDYLENVKCKCE